MLRCVAAKRLPGIAHGRSVGKLQRQLPGVGELAQARKQPDGYEHARANASCRAASSVGSAVAPSIQTSPPSKCSCFQIGVICLMRSIA